MTSSRERQQRAAARARLARQMAERQTAARKRRQLQLIIGSAVAVLVVVAGTVWAVTAVGDDDQTPPVADPAASTSPTPAAPPDPGECAYNPEDPAANPNLQDVGVPEPADEPPAGPAAMTIETNHGTLEVEMDAVDAPCTYASFAHLADQEFYDGTPCHRLTTEGIFVLQCGDPSGTGSGGPAYRFAEENLPVDASPTYPRGTIAMAKTQEPASTGSQFFIVYQDTDLPADYTIIGTVTEGIEIVEQIADDGAVDQTGAVAGDGSPATEVTIESLRVSEPTAP